MTSSEAGGVVIRAEHLRRVFRRRGRTDVVAVDDLDLTVHRGEVLGLLGPNGAGKSTTIKMLTGILVPTSGRLEVAGVDPSRHRTALARRMGVVFGQRTTLWWDLPLGDSLDLLGRAVVNGLGSLCASFGTLLARLLPERAFRRLGGGSSLTLFLLVVAFLLIPTLFVIPASFTPGNAVQANPNGFSLRWYEAVFASTDWTSAAWNSLTVGLASGALALVLGTMAAFAMAWNRFPGKTAALAVILSPLIVPRIVIAVALFFLYSKIELVGTVTGLVIAHAVLAVPYVVITVMAVLATYDRRLDQAAAVMGASRWQTLRRVTLPIIKPGLLSAFLFAFVTSFDELTVALFLTGGSFNTLPRQMWSDLLLQINPTLAAVATLLLVLMTGLLFLNERLRRAAGRS